MKKLLSTALLVFMTFSLSSCFGKTDFEKLATNEQVKIQQEIQANVFEPYIKEIIELSLTENEMTEEEINELMTQKWEELKNNLIKYLQDTYPKVKFNIEELANVDMTYPPKNENEVDIDDLNNIINEVENIELIDDVIAE